MPNRCGVFNCKGNYYDSTKCRVFRLPKDEIERQTWINAIPPRKDFVINASRFFICENHWPADTLMIKLLGGFTRPKHAPTIFNVPVSCLPAPKANPRPPKNEDVQLNHFIKKDKILSFSDFVPDKELYKKYENIIISKSADKFSCVFMTPNFEESFLSVVVENKATLCSPLTFKAYKQGITVPLHKILNPNNGLASYSQFFEAVNQAYQFVPSPDRVIDKTAASLENIDFDLLQGDKAQNFNIHK